MVSQTRECIVSEQKSISRMKSLMVLVMNTQVINGCYPMVNFTNASFWIGDISTDAIYRIYDIVSSLSLPYSSPAGSSVAFSQTHHPYFLMLPFGMLHQYVGIDFTTPHQVLELPFLFIYPH
jgi:hypothetical protein